MAIRSWRDRRRSSVQTLFAPLHLQKAHKRQGDSRRRYGGGSEEQTVHQSRGGLSPACHHRPIGGSGDGGGSNGRDAQDTTKLLGALLRITPRLDAEGYDIPPDNPFADGVADRPEIFVRGFRNPWTFSLDDESGDVWIGDVGNEEFEEIDLVPGGTSGQNFGWYWFEGNKQRRSDAPAGMTPPVYDYPRSDGVAVMGGHVYRGSAIPALRGAYLFADLTGPVWAIGASGVTRLEAERVGTIVGWAQDPAGELYLLGHNSGVYRLVQR